MQPFNPGARPSAPDPRDHAASELYRSAGIDPLAVLAQAQAAPPVPVTAHPLGPVLDQGQTPHCVAYALVGALQYALRTSTGALVDLDPEAFYAAGVARWGADPVAGWDVRSALAAALHEGVPDTAGGLHRIASYHAVPAARIDLETALAVAAGSRGITTVLWETAWPDPWFSPNPHTGLVEHYDGSEIHYGHATHLFGDVARVYGTADTCASDRGSWSSGWALHGNCRVTLGDLLDSRLRWGLWIAALPGAGPA